MRRFGKPISVRRNASPFKGKISGTPKPPLETGDGTEGVELEAETQEVELDGGTARTVGADVFGEGTQQQQQQQQQQQTTAADQSETAYSRRTTKGARNPAQLQAITYLSYQFVYFPERIPKKGDARALLTNYFPYVDIRSRTTPLPNLPEYLGAMEAVVEQELATRRKSEFTNAFKAYSDWKDSNDDYNVERMFELGYEIFQNTVILLVRQDQKTQVIFPGRSTTSYAAKVKGKKQVVKNYVWTPSVEFNTFDFSPLITIKGNIDVNDDYNIGGKRKIGSVNRGLDDQVYLDCDLDKLAFQVNLELTNSLKVAEDYLARSWVTQKVAKARKRLQYKVLVFADMTGLEGAPELNSPNMYLQFMYGYNLGSGLGQGGASRFVPTKMAEDSGVPEDRRFKNPRRQKRISSKSSKRLPSKRRKVTSRGVSDKFWRK